MAIDVNKINVVLPDGVSKVGEISLTGNTAELIVVGSTVGTKNISASYNGGAPQGTVLTVTDETIFESLITAPADRVTIGETIKLVATFSKVPVITEVSVLAPAGFVASVEPVVKGKTVEASYIVGGPETDNAKFEVNFRDGKAVKEVVLQVLERPAVFESVKAEPEAMRVNGESKVTLTFDKKPKLAKLKEVVPEGLAKTVGPTLNNNTVEYTFSGRSVGKHEVQFSYDVQETKKVSIEVLKDAVVTTATADPAEIEVGQDSVISVSYDKAFVPGQDAIKVVLGEGLAEKVPYAENRDKTGGTMTVTGGQAGESRTVTFQLGGAEKVCTLKVIEKLIV